MIHSSCTTKAFIIERSHDFELRLEGCWEEAKWGSKRMLPLLLSTFHCENFQIYRKLLIGQFSNESPLLGITSCYYVTVFAFSVCVCDVLHTTHFFFLNHFRVSCRHYDFIPLNSSSCFS